MSLSSYYQHSASDICTSILVSYGVRESTWRLRGGGTSFSLHCHRNSENGQRPSWQHQWELRPTTPCALILSMARSEKTRRTEAPAPGLPISHSCAGCACAAVPRQHTDIGIHNRPARLPATPHDKAPGAGERGGRFELVSPPVALKPRAITISESLQLLDPSRSNSIQHPRSIALKQETEVRSAKTGGIGVWQSQQHSSSISLTLWVVGHQQCNLIKRHARILQAFKFPKLLTNFSRTKYEQ